MGSTGSNSACALTDGFEIAADVHSRTPKDAEKLAASLGSIKAMMGHGRGIGAQE